MVRLLFVLLPAVCALSLHAAPGAQLQTASNHNATRADFDQLMKELSNWGRWGKDDQMGAANLITPAKRKEAVSSVRDGFSVSMARNAETETAIDNPRPINRVMTPRRGGNPGSPPPDISGASDTTTVSYHGLVHTHMDAFCHRAYKGLMYNGMPMTEVTEQACNKGSKIDLPPGKYRIHIGAREAGAGAVGTIFSDLEVPDLETPPLAMSSLMVTSVDTGGMPTGRAERLGDRLPIVPSTLREFRSSDELTVFAEVYDNEAAKPHTIDITASILTNDRRAVFRHQEQRSSSELRGKAGLFAYGSSIPLKELKPGLYSVRVEATSQLDGETRVAREAQFRVF